MSRVSVHIDESISADPKAILTVNGQSLTLTHAEFGGLCNEMRWAHATIDALRRHYYESLAHKYKEVQDV
jgi:hypothetical protein